MKEELDRLINNLIIEKGGTRKDYRLLMDKIGYHESRLDPKSQQLGGGPGRGKYQFEVGRFKGGKTAANRASRYFKNKNGKVPKWLERLSKEDSVDASKLSNNQQDILFLTNMIEHPKAEFKDVIDGNKTVEDFWADYHWAGNKKDRPARLESFNTSSKLFDESRVNVPEPVNYPPPVSEELSGVFGSQNTNAFANGGTIDPPNNNVTFNPQEYEAKYSDNYPLPFLKTRSRHFTTGQTNYLQDRRKDFLEPNTLAPSGQVVNFDRAVNDPSGRSFLNRYNHPVTRQRLAEQTNLRPEDVDNAILQGLSARKQIGDNVPGSKASYDPNENVINFSEEHANNPAVETHERIHASNLDAALGIPLLDVLGNPFQQETRSLLKRLSPDTLRYLNRPHEAYGNFSEFREKINLKPGEQIDAKELKKRVKKYNLGNENFYRAFDDKRIIEALNTIADTGQPNPNVNQAANGGILSSGCECGCPGKPPCPELAIDDVTKSQKFIRDYHQSPKYKKRWMDMRGTTGDALMDNIKFNRNLDGINKRYDKMKASLIEGNPNNYVGNIGSNYDPNTNYVEIYDNQRISGKYNDGLPAHEFSHASDNAVSLPPKVQEDITKRIRNAKDDHDLDPYETRSDINALRYLLKREGIQDAGEKDFNNKTLRKASKKLKGIGVFDRLRRLYKDKDLIYLMNKIAQNNDNKTNNVA